MDTCRRGREDARDEGRKEGRREKNRDFIQGRARRITMPPTLISRPGPSHVFAIAHTSVRARTHTESPVKVLHRAAQDNFRVSVVTESSGPLSSLLLTAATPLTKSTQRSSNTPRITAYALIQSGKSKCPPTHTHPMRCSVLISPLRSDPLFFLFFYFSLSLSCRLLCMHKCTRTHRFLFLTKRPSNDSAAGWELCQTTHHCNQIVLKKSEGGETQRDTVFHRN